MISVSPLHTAASIRQRGNTFRAMLEDTREVLASLKYATPEDERLAKIQVEAIDEVLTDGTKTG